MSIAVTFILLAVVTVALFLIIPASVFVAILRLMVPLLIGIMGLALSLLGRPLVGVMTMVGAVILWRALSRQMVRRSKQQQITSRTVRSAAFEMEYSHSGEIANGIVLAGRFEGRVLDDMSRADLLRLRDEIETDSSSVELLDAYLDSRFPRWREDTHLDGGAA